MLTTKSNLHFLLHSADLVEGLMRQRLAPLHIRPRQARVLDALARMGEASQVEIAREFGITPASMSTMTSRLVTAGFILRETDPGEMRSNVLRLSESGRELLGDIRSAWTDIDAVVEGAIGPGKAKVLASLTRQLRDALGGTVPGAR